MPDLNPTNTIIAAGIIVTGSTVIRDAHEGKTRAAPIVFGFMMVTALLILAIPFPRTSRGLAFMTMVGAFVVNGPAVFSIASGLSSSPKTPPPTIGGGGGGTLRPT